MKKIALYLLIILNLNSCREINGKEIIVDSGKEVKFNDPILQPYFLELKNANRSSIGFSVLDPKSNIFYKEESKGKVIKLFFEKPNFLRIIYFNKSNGKITYRRESEKTSGTRKMFVKDVDGYKTEIQESINIIYDINKNNLFGENLLIYFLDLDKYPDKKKYNEASSKHYPSVIYETEISLEQAKKELASWKLSKLNEN